MNQRAQVSAQCTGVHITRTSAELAGLRHLHREAKGPGDHVKWERSTQWPGAVREEASPGLGLTGAFQPQGCQPLNHKVIKNKVTHGKAVRGGRDRCSAVHGAGGLPRSASEGPVPSKKCQ
ncbi:hypothetical protein KIL84_021632 [Mauremys mutica]|uniref:Uncharacterized protein n=1 Tax=Mauremys mutica TaxID=74926 RepID=A0A9D3X910_9SAUR|nr:hypothetical protein KIL84_021632 [Mauremys mutica]